MLLRTLLSYRTLPENVPATDPGLEVGTLRYTLPGLVLTVLLLCLGSGLYIMQASAFNNALPLVLKDIEASDTAVAVFMTAIPQLLNMVVTPIVSFRSDRTRSRLGRRMPYLLAAAPFVMLFLLGIGWIHQIAEEVRAVFPFLPESFTLILLGIMIVGYQVFFLVVASIIYYVFPDVIPARYIGRVMALFQLTGSLAGFLFSRYLLKYIDSHMEYLFTGVGIAFAVMMILMTLLVREGDYPPVDDGLRQPTLIDNMKIYFRECYSIPFYYSIFATIALSDASIVCRGMFNLLYARDTLHISVAEFGIMAGWGGVTGVVLAYPLGLLVDRIGALKVYAIGLATVVAVNLWCFFGVRDELTFFIATLLLAVSYTIQMTSTLPVLIAIFPKELYGQFCSASSLLRAGFVALMGIGGGIIFDWLDDYQYIYLWDFLFTLAAFLCFLKLYADWRKRGGHDAYRAPVISHN